MRELINKNIEYLQKLTKEEADFAEHILTWDDEQKLAFKLAKKIFEEQMNANKRKTKQIIRRGNS